MIPIKYRTYLIQYVDFKTTKASYFGPGIHTGSIEEDSDEQDLSKGILYEFIILENNISRVAFFSKDDILKQIKDK